MVHTYYQRAEKILKYELLYTLHFPKKYIQFPKMCIWVNSNLNKKPYKLNAIDFIKIKTKMVINKPCLMAFSNFPTLLIEDSFGMKALSG